MVSDIRLPLDCDLAPSSLRWACELLKEPGPFELLVHDYAYHLAKYFCYDVWGMDWLKTVTVKHTDTVGEDFWVLSGAARKVWSGGA